MEEVVNVYTDNWIKKISSPSLSNHLVCSGKRADLQCFGTRLIQELGDYPESEISVRKLVRRKEKYRIEMIKVIQQE